MKMYKWRMRERGRGKVRLHWWTEVGILKMAQRFADVCDPLAYTMDTETNNAIYHELAQSFFPEQVFSDCDYNTFDTRYLMFPETSEKVVRTDHEENLKQEKDVACQTSHVATTVKREFKRRRTAVPAVEKQKLRRLKATERERRRCEVFNDAFRKLKEVVPNASQGTKYLTTLQMASQYILALTQMLEENPKIDNRDKIPLDL